MKRKILGGTTSFLDRIFVRDTSVTTKVAGLTGLAFNTASLTAYYCRTGDSSATAVTLVTATLGTWVSGGFKEVDAVHMPGWYEVGVPNAAVAAGAASVGLHFRGAANMEDVPAQIELDAVNYQDSAAFGLSAVPVSLTQTLPATPTAGTVGSALSVPDTTIGRRGTAQGGTSTTITLDAGASSVDNAFKYHAIKVISGTGAGQYATVTGYVGSTKVATVWRPTGSWSTTPDNTSVFQIILEPLASADLIQINESTAGVAGLAAQGAACFTGVVSSDTTATTTTFTANSTGSPGLSASAGFYSTPNSLVVFYSGTDSPKAAKCTAYSVAGAVGSFTLGDGGLPSAPAVGDKFMIISIR